jgi:hypothetical protein
MHLIKQLSAGLAALLLSALALAASNDAFVPQSNTMLATSSGVASTSTTTALVFPGTGVTAMGFPYPPPVALVENLGTTTVWVSITYGPRTAAIPATGNTTAEIPILPGTIQTFRAPWSQASSGGTPGTLNLNLISTGVSQQVSVIFGEGI